MIFGWQNSKKKSEKLKLKLIAAISLLICFNITAQAKLEQYKIDCAIEAAQYYEIPANVLLAVAEMEGGKIGQRVRNTNGTYDIGAMQFNTSYIATLTKKYGINEFHLSGEYDACYPFKVAAWRIRQHIFNDGGDIWQRIANYHSRTAQHNSNYRAILIQRSRYWSKWLKTNYNTIAFEGTKK